jgi:hypothetical protein
MKTGWPPGLLQDDSRPLSRWFASKPDARRMVRLALLTLKEKPTMNDINVTITTNPAEIAALIEADAQAQENQAMNLTPTPAPAPTPAPTPEQKTLTPADDVTTLAMALMGGLMPIINRMVEQRFAALVENAATMRLLDETTTDKIIELINQRMDDHERSYDHEQYDDYDRTLDRLSSDVEDLERNALDRDAVGEMVGDYLGEHLSDEVNNLLQNATATVEISV